MSGGGNQLITAYDQPALGAAYKIVAIEMRLVDLQYHQACPIMLKKKFLLRQEAGLAYYQREKGSPRETDYDGIDVNEAGELKCSIRPIPTSIKRSKILEITLYRFLVDIFQERWSIISRSLTEIQAYARKEFDKLGIVQTSSQSSYQGDWLSDILAG